MSEKILSKEQFDIEVIEASVADVDLQIGVLREQKRELQQKLTAANARQSAAAKLAKMSEAEREAAAALLA